MKNYCFNVVARTFQGKSALNFLKDLKKLVNIIIRQSDTVCNKKLVLYCIFCILGCDWWQKQVFDKWMQCKQHKSPGLVPFCSAQCQQSAFPYYAGLSE